VHDIKHDTEELKNVLIYESSSFGGCYEYATKIFPAFKKESKVNSCALLLPVNSNIKEEGVRPVLIRDQISSKNKILLKLHFLYRNILNPFILLFILLKEKKRTFVVFNDFEQISAPLWVPCFKLFFRNKHSFSVILHDPDRDEYPPSKSYSVFCMKKIMSLMTFAFYHGFLPDKIYYKSNQKTKYISIPHGIYELPNHDIQLLEKLLSLKSPGTYVMGILGNIRDEKNYRLSIQALPFLPEAMLLIAGAPSHSGVNIKEYKKLSQELGVKDRIIWVEKFLTENEMASVILFTDIVLLNYSVSFTSQSGILNLIAPYKKKIIVSKGRSSLSITAEKFYLGYLVEPNNLQSFITGIIQLKSEPESSKEHWDKYIEYASWNNMVTETINAFKEQHR
jgi:glycosyltransferase involved in cell wall biosynthesis